MHVCLEIVSQDVTIYGCRVVRPIRVEPLGGSRLLKARPTWHIAVILLRSFLLTVNTDCQGS